MWQVILGLRSGETVVGRATRVEVYTEVSGPIVLIEWVEKGQQILKKEEVGGLYLSSINEGSE